MNRSIITLATALVVVGSQGLAASLITTPIASPIDSPADAVAFEGDELWVADYDVAMRLAKESGKDVLVDFTGSDWCGWCIRLDNEVFSKDAFKNSAPNDFILCKLDFPNGPEAKAKVPNPDRNRELNEQFGIQGYPTILVLTNEGEILGETGYRDGGPESYITHLAEIRTTGRALIAKVNEVLEAFEKAAADKKIGVVERAITVYAEMKDSAPAKRLVPLIEKAMTLDADNAKGLKLKAVRTLLEAGAASADVVTAAEGMDKDNALGLLELCVGNAMRTVSDDDSARAVVTRIEALLATGNIKDEAKVGEMCAMAAYWCANFLDESEKAVVLAKKAMELGVDENMQSMLEEILNGADDEDSARG